MIANRYRCFPVHKMSGSDFYVPCHVLSCQHRHHITLKTKELLIYNGCIDPVTDSRIGRQRFQERSPRSVEYSHFLEIDLVLALKYAGRAVSLSWKCFKCLFKDLRKFLRLRSLSRINHWCHLERINL